MSGYMFRSKLGALIFVCFIVFAVIRMVGIEDKGGDIVVATEQLDQQRTSATTNPAETGGRPRADWHAEALEAGDWGAQTPPPPY